MLAGSARHGARPGCGTIDDAARTLNHPQPRRLSSEEEALRDLVRAREALRGDLMRARQRLSKLLLRHDVIYGDTASAWTARHRAWLTRIDLGGGAQLTLLDYLHAIDALVIRRNALQASIPGARARLTVGADGRAAALPARHRHALRRRAMRRGRRLRTLRARRPADELPRPRAPIKR